MSTTIENLPVEDVRTPADSAELAALVAGAHDSAMPVYPIGGGTILDYGLPITQGGIGVSLVQLNQVIDYPARDMTITVDAGITMASLAAEMARENQRLPIDVPHSDRATLGGVIATNWGGPRRYGCGTIRDYVIGIHVVDGRGRRFRGGGRVVKNVAGYDFCKLMVGSLGTLGIITQVTLKAMPSPQAAAFLACDVRDAEQAESVLAALVTSETYPMAIELARGPAWQDAPVVAARDSSSFARLLVGFEGTAAEVDWMLERLATEWREQDVSNIDRAKDAPVNDVWSHLSAFPAATEPAATLRASLPPSRLVSFISEVLSHDPDCSILAHAGNGIALIRLSERATPGIGPLLVNRLHPAAKSRGGHLAVVSAPPGVELTRQAIFGGTGEATGVMRAVKRQFDPKHILNPGRFLFESP